MTPTSPFLTEFVTLETHQLTQRGIILKMDHKAFVYDGPYSAKRHLNWIEDRRRNCQRRGWLTNNLAKYGGDQLILFGEHLNLPNYLMELIWKYTDSPTGTPISELNNDYLKVISTRSEIQLPFISWLNENDLINIAKRLKELEPNKNNPVGNSLWEHANLVKDILEGWFIRNDVKLPKIEYPGITLTDQVKFDELIKSALNCGPQTEEQLWDWKKRFDEFHSNYFTRYESRHGDIPQGEGSNNGLEWRRNPKYRKKRNK